MELYEQALNIAVKAHKEQTRKHDGSPYISHPIIVGRILEKAGFSEIVVAAGLVHDVLEDTSVTEDELQQILGAEVVRIVAAVSEEKSLVWEDRKKQYIQRVISSNESVWAVSVADKIHNASCLIAFHKQVGPAAWQVFNRGKEQKVWFEKSLLEALQSIWKHPLLEVYSQLIDEMEALEA
jgi:(p)ppGpp synthase/HD superfamily hydrolase